MENQAEQKDQATTVWPPPIQHYIHPPKPLNKGEMLLVRWRWLYTLSVPFWLIFGVLGHSEHKLHRDIMFAFNVLIYSAVAVRAWLLFARSPRDEGQH